VATLIPSRPAVRQIRIMMTPLTNKPVTGPDARALSFAGEFKLPSVNTKMDDGEGKTIGNEVLLTVASLLKIYNKNRAVTRLTDSPAARLT
jgi:hypothetical protein